jgi:hypothetical protein
LSPSNQGEELLRLAVAAFPLWEHAWLVIALFGKAVYYIFQKRGAKISIHHKSPSNEKQGVNQIRPAVNKNSRM